MPSDIVHELRVLKQKERCWMDVNSLVKSIYEISMLRRILRSHQQPLLVTDPTDNIAAHSHLVAYIGMLLASLVDGVDPLRVMGMCVLHDTPESRTGDQNWLHKSHVVIEENVIRDAQVLPLLDQVPLLRELVDEYEARETLAAKVAKDADHLAQIVLLREYAWSGNGEAALWLETRDNKRNRLYTHEARELFDEIYDQSPGAWWKGLESSTRKKPV